MPRDGPKRKISYAIQPSTTSSYSRSRRVPQLVGLGAFIVGALIITVGLVFGIGPSDEFGASNATDVGDSFSYQDELHRYAESRTCQDGTVNYRFAIVSTNSKICSTVGTEIMARKRGSAIDAAIATLLCLGIANPQSSGIGAGFLMTYYRKSDNKVYTLDARETASVLNRSLLLSNPRILSTGGMSIGVPGELRGYRQAHERFGRLTWKELFNPVLKIAEEGIKIGAHLYKSMKDVQCAIEQNPSFGIDFINPMTGRLREEGDRLLRNRFLNTLRTIANAGDSVFYDGPLTDDIVDDVNSAGGNITRKDLENYKAVWRDPIKAQVNGGSHTLYTTSSPSVGPALVLGINLLEAFNMSRDLFEGPQTVRTYHNMVEILRQVKAHTQEIGDPDSETESYTALQEMLTSLAYAVQVQKSRISASPADEKDFDKFQDSRPTAVSHVNIISPEGDVVSVSTSLSSTFGSRVVGSKTGIIFNNALSAFYQPKETKFGANRSSLDTSKNRYSAGRRALSQMCPVILVDNNSDRKLALGAVGDHILAVQTQVLMRHIFLNEALETAITQPRVYAAINPSKVYYVKKTPPIVSHGLRILGHTMTRIWHDESSALGTVFVNISLVKAVVEKNKGYCIDGY
ncbi:scoloptoxin SSD14-like [Tubulanus polymorphus]|uniref:scoloptoxin SSD14-like n=1 Tax=Tubulanus polymorphus TaxID=672921 RepID=UPI003DA559D2